MFEKALQRLATCLSVRENFCGKLVWSLKLSIIIDDSFKVIPVVFFVADFNISVCESDKFVLLSHFVWTFYENTNKIYRILYNTLRVPLEKSKIVSCTF